jgi:hypothetical protein
MNIDELKANGHRLVNEFINNAKMDVADEFFRKRQIIPTSSAIAFTAIGLRKIGSQTQLLTAIVTGLIFCGRSFFKSCSDCASGSFSKIYLKYA